MARNRRLLALEVATVLVIAGLAMWSVRPLVEEWGTLNNFNQQGLLYPWQGMLRYMALRPLHMVGYLLQWVAGGGTPIGVPIVAALTMVARYAIVRWAVTPVLEPAERWVVATFAAVLFAWPAAWFGRYLGAQISVLLFFAALGCSLRLARERSALTLLLGALSAFAALLFYQALAILMVLASILCAAWAWRITEPRQRPRQASRAGMPFIIALTLYALYAIALSSFGFGLYETGMVGEPLSPALIASRLVTVYVSAFGSNPLTAPLLLAVAVGFVFVAAAGVPIIIRGRYILATMLAVLALPIASLVYLHIGHARDLDRTLFPVSVGFVLVLIVIGAATRGGVARARSIAGECSLVTIGLLVSLGLAHQARTYWDIQSSVIVQMLENEFHAEEGILLKDTTGILGDMYTFNTIREPDGVNRTILQRALQLYGLDTSVGLCTPSGIDRRHTVAWRHPLSTTDRCEETQYYPPHDLVLVARSGPNGIVLGLEPTRRISRGRPVRFNESGVGDAIIVDGWSGQEPEFRWSDGPTASLAVELVDGVDHAGELVLTLEPFLGGGLAAQRVDVAIDGVDAGTWQVDRRDDYGVTVPPAAMSDGRLAIVLSISNPTAPCNVMASTDCRELGVAIRKLVVN